MPRRGGQSMSKHSGSGHGGGASAKRNHQTQGIRKRPYPLSPWAFEPTPAAQGIAAAEHADRLTQLMKQR